MSESSDSATTVDSEWDAADGVCDRPREALDSNPKLSNRAGKCNTCGQPHRLHAIRTSTATASGATEDAMSKALAKGAASLSVAARFRVPGIQTSPQDSRCPIDLDRAARHALQMHSGWMGLTCIRVGQLADSSDAPRTSLLQPWKLQQHVAALFEAVGQTAVAVLHVRAGMNPALSLEEMSVPRMALADGAEGAISGAATLEMSRICISTGRGLRMLSVRDKALFANRSSNNLGEFNSPHNELTNAHWFVVSRGKSIVQVVGFLKDIMTGTIDPRCMPRGARIATASPSPACASASASAAGSSTSAATGRGHATSPPPPGTTSPSHTPATSRSSRGRSSQGIASNPADTPIRRHGPEVRASPSSARACLDIVWWIENVFFTAIGEAAKADGFRSTRTHLDPAWALVDAAEATTLAALKAVGAATAAPKPAPTGAGAGRGGQGDPSAGRGGAGRGGRGEGDTSRGRTSKGTGGRQGGGGRGAGTQDGGAGATGTPVRALADGPERVALRATIAAKDPNAITKAEAIKADLCFKCKAVRHPPGPTACVARGIVFPHGPVFE